MSRLKISTQLGLLVAGGITLLIVCSAAGLWGMHRTGQSLHNVYSNHMVPATHLATLESALASSRLELATVAADPGPEKNNAAALAIEANIARANQSWDDFAKLALDADEAELARKFADARAQFVKDGLRASVDALKAGENERARLLIAERVPKLHESALVHLRALLEMQKAAAQHEATQADARENSLLMLLGGTLLLGLVLASAVGLTMGRRLTRALGAEPDELREVVDAVAKGDLSRQIVVRSGDTGSVMASLKSMVATLSQSVGTVRRNADSVATAASQIAQGNMDLSGRTEQQASALEETASSMEELGSTVRLNADNARQANQLAMSASTVAVQGGDVVARVVDTMKGINDSSKKIADIISVIDGIAFQTNILALNAAVEAARAGEQGRGFAVVAAEVRSLAQRSAEAAKEIKELITASVERVGQGTELVDRAGHTMEEVVASIKRVTDIMGEISAASSEQSAGVAQVGQAITQMDQATQQNAALVEQSAAAAESLKSQAQALVQAVAAFRLSQGGGSLDLFDAEPAPRKATAAPARAPAKARPAAADSPSTPAPAATASAPRAESSSPPKAKTESAAPALAGGDDDWATF
ncbi:MAG: Tar ligand binding domain-containing protein [Rubrivivax sp.]|nr:Tar ligand binding domain-containing protein [Rubrivivax sp.]